MSTQLQVEWLVPNIQKLSLETVQLSWKIAEKEAELKNLPEVIRIEKELFDLKVKRKETENKELALREQGKQMMLDNDLKEFTTLDGTTIAIQFTPWALTIEESATVPPEYFRSKTTVEVDKVGLKKAISEWKEFEGIYIVKDAKFVIKNK